MVDDMEYMVKLCFNDVEVNSKKIDEYVSVAEKNTKNKKLRDKACDKLWQGLETIAGREGANDAPIGASVSIRDCIDDAFMQHLGPTTDVRDIFADDASNRWRIALGNYYAEIIEELPKVVGTMTEMNAQTTTAEEPDEEEQRMEIALRTCVTKVKMVYAVISYSVPCRIRLLPFMTRSVYSHMVSKTELIPNALTEVSHRS